jgi:glycosyltransferase involved in cell wall biosynthesis
MRVAVFSNLLPPLWVGGYEIGAARVIEALRQRGHDVLVLTAHQLLIQQGGKFVAQEQPCKLKSELVDMGPCLLGSLARLALRAPWLLPALLATVTRARQRLNVELERFDPDLVLLFNPLGMLAPVVEDCLSWGRRHHVPVRAYVSDSWLADWPIAHPLYRLLPARFFASRRPRADSDLYCSQYLYNASCGRIQDRVVPWGMADISAAPLPLHHFQSPTPLRLLFVGQIEPHKGLQELIRALAACHQPHRLVVLGNPHTPHAHVCRNVATELGLAERVLWVGRQSPQSMPSLLRQLGQVLVLPSLWPEPLSLSMLEGMAAGLPVIASATGGTPEAIQDQRTGLLFDPSHPQELTAAIDRLENDRALAHRLGCRAWAEVRDRFAIEPMIDEVIQGVALRSADANCIQSVAHSR